MFSQHGHPVHVFNGFTDSCLPRIKSDTMPGMLLLKQGVVIDHGDTMTDVVANTTSMENGALPISLGALIDGIRMHCTNEMLLTKDAHAIFRPVDIVSPCHFTLHDVHSQLVLVKIIHHLDSTLQKNTLS